MMYLLFFFRFCEHACEITLSTTLQVLVEWYIRTEVHQDGGVESDLFAPNLAAVCVGMGCPSGISTKQDITMAPAGSPR